jgi:hypothetical protein
MVSLKAELAQVIAELHMVSHVSAANLEPGSPSSEAKGGRKPAGGISHEDDRDRDAPLKSAEHFVKRMAGCRTDGDYVRVLEDARAALDRWKRTPHTSDPEWGSYRWRCQIAEDIETRKRTVKEAMQFYSVSQATVYRYVAAHGKRAA